MVMIDSQIQWLIDHDYMEFDNSEPTMTNKAISVLTCVPVEEIERYDRNGFTADMVMELVGRTARTKERYGIEDPTALLYAVAQDAEW